MGKKIIFDTDIGGDCDDTGALAILHRACEAGLCELLCVTVSTVNPWSSACADAINRYYGRPVPIGKTERRPANEVPPEKYLKWYGKHVAEHFPNEYMPETGREPEDAVRLLRRTLSENRGEKITLVVVGSLVNLCDLLTSEADELSPLSGVELVREQVGLVSLMGGRFADEAHPTVNAEWNIFFDVESSRRSFELCPVPIAVSHFDVGDQIKTGAVLIERERENPVAEAYEVHSHGNRSSWDPISAFYAVYGTADAFEDTRRGFVCVDEAGVTTFTAGDGLHCLIDCPDPALGARRLDEAMLGIFRKR